jgi:hypothetical protein
MLTPNEKMDMPYPASPNTCRLFDISYLHPIAAPQRISVTLKLSELVSYFTVVWIIPKVAEP